MLNTKVYARTNQGVWKRGTIVTIHHFGLAAPPLTYDQANETCEFTVIFDDTRTPKQRVPKHQIFPYQIFQNRTETVVDLTHPRNPSIAREEKEFRAITPSKPDYASKFSALKQHIATKQKTMEKELSVIKKQIQGPIQNQLDDLNKTFNWQLYDSFRMDKQVEMYSPQLKPQEDDSENLTKDEPEDEAEEDEAEEDEAEKKRKYELALYKHIHYDVAKKGERTNRRMSKRQRTGTELEI